MRGGRLAACAYSHGVTLRFIRPGKPIENAYVERFNGTFRDEWLNEHWFVNLASQCECWSMDFISARLVDGRWFRTLAVLDLFTRESLALVPESHTQIRDTPTRAAREVSKKNQRSSINNENTNQRSSDHGQLNTRTPASSRDEAGVEK